MYVGVCYCWQLELVEGASVLIRLCDGRRDDELPSATFTDPKVSSANHHPLSCFYCAVSNCGFLSFTLLEILLEWKHYSVTRVFPLVTQNKSMDYQLTLRYHMRQAYYWCLGGAVVRASDFWSGGHGFDSRSARYQAPRSTQPSIPSG